MQVYSNNAQTTVAVLLAADSLSLVVANADSFTALTAGQYEFVTLSAGTLLEIVKVTARAGTTWTIERAQEGTTALLWTVGAKVEARITAGTLTNFVQSATLDDYTTTADLPNEITDHLDTNYADVAGLDSDGNARGTNALNLQPGRANANEVASGSQSIALGYASRAEGTNTVSIGNNARTFHNGDIAIGVNTNTFNAPAAIAIGKGTTVSATQGVAIGDEATCTGDYGIAIGDAVSCGGGNGVAIGKGSSCTGSFSPTAIGNATATGNFGTVAIGNATATGNSAVAIGSSAEAIGTGTLAIGNFAKAYVNFSSAIGNGSQAIKYTMALNGAWMAANPTLAWNGFATIPQDDWGDGYERTTTGCQAAFVTPYVDLGIPPNWSATTYQHGQLVKPTTGGTVQYRAWLNRVYETGLRPTNATATASEPTWPGAGDSVELDVDGEHYWVGIDWGAGYATDDIPQYATFFPTEIAFLCRHYEATTGTPTISVGISTDSDLFLNAVNVTTTGAPQIQRFTLANPNAGILQGESLLITVNSFASAGRMVGHFLISGYFVENPTYE